MTQKIETTTGNMGKYFQQELIKGKHGSDAIMERKFPVE